MLLDITLPQREKSYEVDKSYPTMRHVNRKSTHTHVKICTKKKVKGSPIVNHFVSFLLYFNFCKVCKFQETTHPPNPSSMEECGALAMAYVSASLEGCWLWFVPSFYLFIQAWIHIHMMCLCILTYQSLEDNLVWSEFLPSTFVEIPEFKVRSSGLSIKYLDLLGHLTGLFYGRSFFSQMNTYYLLTFILIKQYYSKPAGVTVRYCLDT